MFLLTIILLSCGASAQEAPSAESAAVRQAREEYRRALERHVAYGLLGGNLGDSEGVELEREARAAGTRYREAAGRAAARPARLKDLPRPAPAAPLGSPSGRGWDPVPWAASALVTALLAFGLDRYRRRPRELRCMPCGQRLRVRGKSGTVRLRCPKCRSESVFKL